MNQCESEFNIFADQLRMIDDTYRLIT
jgi:hypothetical protein